MWQIEHCSKVALPLAASPAAHTTGVVAANATQMAQTDIGFISVGLPSADVRAILPLAGMCFGVGLMMLLGRLRDGGLRSSRQAVPPGNLGDVHHRAIEETMMSAPGDSHPRSRRRRSRARSNPKAADCGSKCAPAAPGLLRLWVSRRSCAQSSGAAVPWDFGQEARREGLAARGFLGGAKGGGRATASMCFAPALRMEPRSITIVLTLLGQGYFHARLHYKPGEQPGSQLPQNQAGKSTVLLPWG